MLNPGSMRTVGAPMTPIVRAALSSYQAHGLSARSISNETPAMTQPAEWTPPTWDEVVHEHADRVYRLAYRLCGNRVDAEDLTQETFLRVFKALRDFRPGPLEGWLHRITTNLFLDLARRRQGIRFLPLLEDADRPLVATTADPERAYLQRQLAFDIQHALDALPADVRAAVVLRDLEQLPYEEIATTLAIKVGTARTRVHRGRVMLRNALPHRAPRARRVEVAARPA
jgi:RNA polymerase sigma factor (sigma-70 family)